MGNVNLRNPAVAGQFYPATASEITEQIEGFLDKSVKRSDYSACLMPHAGYVYSGAVAVAVASRINIPERVVLLGPNHTGYGAGFSIMASGVWQTPMAPVRIDQDLAGALLAGSKYLQNDHLAHKFEHSLEVELPILQYFRKDFQIVPVCFMSDDYQALAAVGKEIASVLKDLHLEKSTLILASSDMTHYEPKASAGKKDNAAIQAILDLDEQRLFKTVRELKITMCGYAPVVAMLSAVKSLGAKSAELVKYQTSGDITGDNDSVVGYAGILVK